MGEFDWGTYTEGSGGDFFKEDDFIVAVKLGTVFQATAVRERVDDNPKYGAQYLLDFVDDEGDERTKTFKKGIDERDGRLKRIQETIETTGEPMAFRFTKVGRRHDVTGA